MKKFTLLFLTLAFMMTLRANKWNTEPEINAENISLQAPPENADSLQVLFINYRYNCKDDYYLSEDFHMRYDTIPVVKYEDSIYFKIPVLWRRPDDTKMWLKGIIEGNKVRFKNNEPLFIHQYEEDMWNGYTVVRKDTLNFYSANFGDKKRDSMLVDPNFHDRENPNGLYWEYYYWDVFYTDLDLIADCSSDPILIRRPNSGFLTSDYPEKVVQTCYPEVGHYLPYFNKYTTITSSFMIGQCTSEDPNSLAAPRLRFFRFGETGSMFPDRSFSVDINLGMDILNEEGYILDYNRMYFDFYIYGKYMTTYDYKSVAAPVDMNGPIITIYVDSREIEWKGRPFELEAICYYLTEDGRRIESPKVMALNCCGIDGVKPDPDIQPQEDSNIEDGQIYDLTGRPVRSDNLQPGIYIRNGRKFICR